MEGELADNELPPFSINGWFNDKPIRAIGMPKCPYFYAIDVGKVLGVASIRSTLRSFDETEIVSQEIRQRENLLTYRRVGDKWRLDPKIILLTEAGLYKIIMISKSEVAKEFKAFIYRTIHETRMHEIEQLKMAIQNNPEEFPEHETIYFIAEMPYNDMVKIGRTRNIQRRLRELQTGNPSPLIILCMVDKHVAQNYEYILHVEFAARRVMGEWFRFEPGELHLVYSKCAAEFDD